MRFEQTFLKSLQNYANIAQKSTKSSSKSSKSAPNSIESAAVDVARHKRTNGEVLNAETEELPALAPITPGIVIYAVLRDVVLRPLVDGFTWAMILILAKPTLRFVTAQGYQCGVWFSKMIGLRE